MLQKVQGEIFSVKSSEETQNEEKLDLVKKADTKEIISDNDDHKKEEMEEKPSIKIGGIKIKNFHEDDKDGKGNTRLPETELLLEFTLVQNLKIGDDDFDNDTEEDVGVDTDDTDDSTVENNFDNVKEDDNKADVMKTDSKKPESLLKNNFDTSMEGLLGE